VARLSDEWICRGREFQLLLGKDTQKSWRGKRRFSKWRKSNKL